MKFMISTFLLLLGPRLSGQVEKYVGDYEIRRELKNALVECRLPLSHDGGFLFQSYSKHDRAATPVSDMYGKGKWSAKKNLIHFSIDEKNDVGQGYSLNFNNTKARYKTESLRNLSDRVVKMSLIFYDSDIFWLKGMELFIKEHGTTR